MYDLIIENVKNFGTYVPIIVALYIVFDIIGTLIFDKR